MEPIEMRPVDTCEVCGEEVPADQGHRADLTIGGAMCPTPMILHDACFDAVGAIWAQDDGSTCVVDDLYPETSQWTPYVDVTGPRGRPRT